MQKLPSPIQSLMRHVYGVVPVRFRLGKEYIELRRFLQEAQWWDRERIETWQLMRLKEIVKHAYENVPGYRALCHDKGVKPEDIQTLGDIRLLPFMTKELIRDNFKDFVAQNLDLNKCRYVTTGGSTGIPVGFYHTAVNVWMENAFMHSGWERAGWKLGETSAVLRGAFVGSEERFWSYDPVWKELLLSTYYLTERTYRVYLDKILTFRPQNLQAYPSAATMLADLVLENGDIGRLNFKIIFLGSENIYNWQKEKLRQAFPYSRLFGWYGHTEQAVLAHWCEYSETYHIWPFYGFVEVLDEAGSEVEEGKTGEIVATSFWNFATPFIRYRTMDIARKGKYGCQACGRQFLLLEDVEGRLQEMIVTAQGRYISMTAINIHSDVFDNVRQFQFYQDTPGKVILKIVPKETYSAQDAEKIYQEIKKKLGEDMDLELMLVAEIPRTQRGKARFLEQRLKLRYGE
ncbi:MAG: phenylacetate--CoA ligase family protein [Candidatus Bathyarchaeia archaeon]